MDDRTPILIGAGVASQRLEDPTVAVEPVELMRRALAAAIDDAGAPRIADRVDQIVVPEGIWDYRDPGRLVLDGRSPAARTVVADVGVLQQTMFSQAASAIAGGSLDVVVIAGGEARDRHRRSRVLGVQVHDTPSTDEPDERWRPEKLPINDIEIHHGLAAPTHQYAVIESAIRAEAGRSDAEHARTVYDLVASLSAVAATNPDAWTPTAMTAEQVAAEPMIASPYTRPCCAQWNVDQASAFVLCSVGVARALGVAADRWVFPWAAAESNLMVPLTERADLVRNPGVAQVGTALTEATGVAPADADLLELYSCFPAAVQVQCRELGIGTGRPLTITGGMHFAGGPLNSFTLQALAAMVPLLRADPSAVGLTTSVSGTITKYGAQLWSASPPERGFAAIDVTDPVRALTRTVPVDRDHVGPATVVGYTIGHTKGAPSDVSVVADTPAGARAVATTSAADVIDAMRHGEWIGREVELDGVTLLGPRR